MKKLLVSFPFFFFISCCFISCDKKVTKETTHEFPKKDSLYSKFEEVNILKKGSLNSALQLNKKLLEDVRDYDNSLEADLLMQRASLFRKTNLDSTTYYTEKLLQLQQKRKDSLAIADAYFRLGFYFRKNNKIDKSLAAYYNSIKTYESVKDTIEAGMKLLNLTNLLNAIGNYNEAEQTGVRALQYLENTKNRKYVAGIYNALAIASKKQKIYGDALHWYNKALNVASDSITKSKVENNIAVVYTEQGAYKKAYKLLDELSKQDIIEDEDNLELKARNIDNKANVASFLEYPDAEEGLKKALEIRRDINDASGQATSYLHLSNHYLKNNQIHKASSMALLGFKLAQQTKSNEDTMEALSLLIASSNNPRTYAMVYKELNDSITTSQGRLKNTFAKIRYESDKNREENLKLLNEAKINQLRIEKQHNNNIALGVVIVIIVIASYIFYLLLRAKHQREKADQAYQTEMLISKKVHDELANDMFNIIAYTENSTLENKTKDDILYQLEGVYEKTRNIARDNARLDIDEQFSEKIIGLINSYRNDTVNILNRGLSRIVWEEVPTYKKRVIYRSLQELLVNMKKHSKASVVVLNFTSEKKDIQISYSDNGCGVDLTRDFVTNGLVNVENRIDGIKGSFTFDSSLGKGFKANITIPV